MAKRVFANLILLPQFTILSDIQRSGPPHVAHIRSCDAVMPKDVMCTRLKGNHNLVGKRLSWPKTTCFLRDLSLYTSFENGCNGAVFDPICSISCSYDQIGFEPKQYLQFKNSQECFRGSIFSRLCQDAREDKKEICNHKKSPVELFCGPVRMRLVHH